MIGVGTIFQRYSLGTWTSIAEILSINVEGEDRDAIDVTTLDTDEGYVDEISGLREGGEVVLSMIFSRGMFELLFSDFNLNTSGQYRIALQDADESTFNFEGFVIDMDEVEEASNKITADVTIKITGILELQQPLIFSHYGLIYNRYAATDERIAPVNYHVPTTSEAQELADYMGEGAALHMRKTDEGWALLDGIGDNNTGFSAMGSGYRYAYNGAFTDKNYAMIGLVSNIQYDEFSGYYLDGYELIISSTAFIILNTYNISGAIRLVRDSLVGWVEGEVVTDYDGISYHTCKIGNQVWTVENLAVTHFRDGALIPEVTDPNIWKTSTSAALCAYNNDWRDVFES